MQQAPSRAADAREQHTCPARLSDPPYRRGKTIRSDSQSAVTAAQATRPNKVWVTDITYVRTWQGWLYLAIVMDLLSHRVVGWAASAAIHRDLLPDAVLKAVKKRKPCNTTEGPYALPFISL